MQPDPVDDIQPPYIKGFFTILPDAVPIGHKSTWFTFVDELETDLDNWAHTSQPGGVNYFPANGLGRNFVSIRFWQMDDTVESVSEADHRMIGEVVDILLNDEQKANRPEVDESLKPNISTYRTVVEMITYVARDDDLIATESKPDPLTRCLDVLLEFHRSYRILSDFPVQELTYKRIHPMLITFRRAIDSELIHPDGVMLTHMEAINFGSFRDQIGKVNFDDVQMAQARMKKGDPVIAFRERMSDAMYAFRKLGANADAIVQLGIACEILFDGLLGMLLWEKGKTPKEAAETFSKDITPRIRSEFTPLLGGTPFSLDDPGALKTWYDDVAGIRNRVVHGNHRPTDGEVAAAFDGVEGLTSFFGDKLAAKWSTFPVTTFGFIGPDGLAARNALSNRAKKWIEDNSPDMLSKIEDYATWRQAMEPHVQRRRRSS